MKLENIRSVGLIVILFVIGITPIHASTVCCSEKMYKSIPQWNCGNPPTVLPKREDINTGNEIEDLKLFHMTVADFRARSYAWMVCTTNFIHNYPRAIDYWGRTLIKEHEVIIQ